MRVACMHVAWMLYACMLHVPLLHDCMYDSWMVSWIVCNECMLQARIAALLVGHMDELREHSGALAQVLAMPTLARWLEQER